MLVEYTEKLYMPLMNITNKYFNNLEDVTQYYLWKKELYNNWNDVKIFQKSNLDNITLDAGNNIEVSCAVELPNIDRESICVEAYYGKILDNGVVKSVAIIPMQYEGEVEEKKNTYIYKAKIELTTGGNYGYTFRVMPKHQMLLDSANLDLVKWITNE
jgi:starch phosphorylase